MADKMMRVAVRDGEGKAKALRGDRHGGVVMATNNAELRNSDVTLDNKVFDLDGSSSGSIYESTVGTVVDSLAITFNHEFNGYFTMALFKITGQSQYAAVYRPDLGSYTNNIRPSHLNTEENGRYLDMFELVIYDTKNNIYVVRNRFPIHAPYGLNLRVHGSAGTKIAASIVAREVNV